MDVSLDEIIKQKKTKMAKRRPQQQQQQQQRGQRQQQQARRPPVGDARDRISKLRKQQLVSQDARQRIQQRKRMNIKDARQLLADKRLPQPLLSTPRAAGGVQLPQKVVANNLYKQRPAPPPPPPPLLEYEDEPPYRQPAQLAHATGPQVRPRPVREIPVQVTRQRRERSRSPVRRHQPVQQQPPPPQQQQATIVQAYKVSISNLHRGVTREDIYELFSNIGPVKKCVLIEGGAAEVVFPDKEHALTAVRRYDRRELDGMPMQLRLSVVGIKVHSTGTAAAAIDERAVRAALFHGGAGGGGGNRPVNFQVSV